MIKVGNLEKDIVYKLRTRNAHTKYDGSLSTPITVNSKAKQGCLLSPILLLMPLDNLLRHNNHIVAFAEASGGASRK